MKIKNIYGEWVNYQILPHEYAVIYRDYFNNYLTLDCFAESMLMHPKQAIKVINKGRVLHNDIFGNT